MTGENKISWEDFEKVEIRIGTFVGVEDIHEVRCPAYKIRQDFGRHGIKQSGAQLTKLNTMEELLNCQVICVASFHSKKIAGFKLEILITGFILYKGRVVLVQLDRPIQNGPRPAGFGV
jgi:tRNA-binding protein